MASCAAAATKLADACDALSKRPSDDAPESSGKRQALACYTVDMAACVNTALARSGACDELLRRCVDTGTSRVQPPRSARLHAGTLQHKIARKSRRCKPQNQNQSVHVVAI